MNQRFGFLTLVVLGASLPGLSNIQYTCDSSISNPAYAPAGICNALNGSSVSGVYSSIFSNVNASIYITFGATGVGQSSFNITQVSYASYYAALASHTDDPGALASLGGNTDPLGAQSNGEVDLTAALASSLGITDGGANTAGVLSNGVTSCVLGPGNPGCYNGVITITNALINGITPAFYYPPSAPTDLSQIDFYMVAEHETDEILGTISCIGGNNVDQCNPAVGINPQGTDASPADLFRYAGPNTRSFLATSNSCSGGFPSLFAYFSIDSGTTDIADYNNCQIGGDYGDWINIYPYLVQDGGASPNATLDISTDVGTNSNHYPRPEVAVLDAVGFNLTPEPATFGLLGASLLALGFARGRRNKK